MRVVSRCSSTAIKAKHVLSGSTSTTSTPAALQPLHALCCSVASSLCCSVRLTLGAAWRATVSNVFRVPRKKKSGSAEYSVTTPINSIPEVRGVLRQLRGRGAMVFCYFAKI